ncbi:MAG: pilus assembly protein PilM [Atopobiaceae bacterium]|jgi:type IV pilus assembly protein PilM|nr:pilus assembly protein PilM [Atopobiaceae bacterium]
MAASYVGIDIGHGNCNIAVRDGDVRLITTQMPENLVGEDRITSPASLATFLKDLRRDEHIRARSCALALNETTSFFRHVTLPAMSQKELALNLPYEFRDFINGDTSDYVFDYLVDEVVNDEEGKPQRLELFAAAARKDLVESATAALRKAGFKPQAVLPVQVLYARLIKEHIAQNPTDNTTCLVLVNVSFSSTTVTLFIGSHYEASKVIEVGCADLDTIIANVYGIDPYTAASYRRSDFEGVLETPDCQAVYDQLATEVSKVVNFFNFSNPDKDVERACVLGTGATIKPLTDTIEGSLSVDVLSAADLVPGLSDQPDAPSAALAFGALLEGEAI